MRRTRVQLIDKPGFSHDVIAWVIAEQPGAELVSDAPDVIVVDDRLFAEAIGPATKDVDIVVLGADDDPAYAARAARLGAQWIPKESAQTLLPPLLSR